MHPFDFVSPSTLDDAVAAMAGANGQARALAGGSDLIDQLRVGRRNASLVVDIKNIPEMQRLQYIAGEGLHVGAGVSCTTIYNYAPVAEHYPSVQDSTQLIGSVQIQNRAGIGGNVCNAAPSGDTIPPLLTYGAEAHIRGPNGWRKMLLEDFFKGPGQSDLAADELLVEVFIPEPPANSSGHYQRFIPREEMDIAVAGAASMVAIDPATNRCTQARVALASVAPTPVRALETEAALEGQVLTRDLVRQAAELAPNSASPINDVRGTVEYRRQLCKVLTRRTMEQCLNDLGID